MMGGWWVGEPELQRKSFLALMLVFQVLGLIWMAMSRRNESSRDRFFRAVLPAVIGGLTILGMIAVPVFMSHAFIYRNAFGLTISKTSVANGALLADGVLEIKKPGSYDSSAPRAIYLHGLESDDTESATELGKITWGAADAPKIDSTGSYPFQIRWEKRIPASLPAFDAVEATDNLICMEVRAAGNGPGDLLYILNAPMAPSTP